MEVLSIAVAAASVIAFTQIASAADLSRKAPAFSPPPPVHSTIAPNIWVFEMSWTPHQSFGRGEVKK